METLHQANDIIGERYRLVTPLGEGAFGTTYEAEDLTNYRRVAIKALSLKHLTDWKVLELFEREANVLAYLHHPSIPKYFESFFIDTPTNRRFYLVRELIDGESLADLVKKGWHATEEEIKHIAIQILECLEYLHGLEPPAVHRDIKPQNIIRRRDGNVFLVDFGAIQEVYRNTLANDGTFVGTMGYMPPEQYSSQVKPATDIYALGATLLFLVTHRAPDDLPQYRLKIEFRDRVNLSPKLADVLEKMLEPFIEDRFQSAREVLEVLKGDCPVNNYLPLKYEQPRGSRVVLQKTGDRLVVDIPPTGLLWYHFLGLPYIMIYICFSTFFVDQKISYESLIKLINDVPGVIPFFIYVCLGWLVVILGVVGSDVVGRLALHTHLEIDRQTFKIQWNCLGFRRQVWGKVAHLQDVLVANPSTYSPNQNQNYLRVCVLVEGIRKHSFGSRLKIKEQRWLVSELADFLGLENTINVKNKYSLVAKLAKFIGLKEN